jgi:hypothetical protein
LVSTSSFYKHFPSSNNKKKSQNLLKSLHL